MVLLLIGLKAEALEQQQLYTLPKLAYEYDELEPYIDAKTMEIHHLKHHQAYLDKLNEIVASYPKFFAGKTIEDVLSQVDKLPDSIRQHVINQGGGYANHNLFWNILSPQGGDVPSGELEAAINERFGDFESFQLEFNDQLKSLFGSGWVWLVVNENDALEIIQTTNQDSPLSSGKTPILGIDVWEHAYYLGNQNRRGDYIENIWHVINWCEVEKLYDSALN